ncbi:hypothetical protein BCR34DRAFT_237657 [Clohesyomyces aquaticus]|uniref:Uncharacterized protein n=1 Tax=Clohesyomyces aquaticus TaxID=1231657 RepID=A0A1Y1ZVL9_9PLEO|nr:hypothetical protein BCR34DRAFT_237657 [Clohesyomyces aquaticus]
MPHPASIVTSTFHLEHANMANSGAAGMLPKRALAEIDENVQQEVPRKKLQHDAHYDDPATDQENAIPREVDACKNRERSTSPPLIPPSVPINRNDSSASAIPASEFDSVHAECFAAIWQPFQPSPDTRRVDIWVNHPEFDFLAPIGHPHLLSMTDPHLPYHSTFRACDLVATVLWSFGDGQAWRMFDNPGRYQICAFRHLPRQMHGEPMRPWDHRGLFIGRKGRKAYIGCYSYATGDTWDFETFVKFDIEMTGWWTPLVTATAYKTNKNDPTTSIENEETRTSVENEGSRCVLTWRRRSYVTSRDMARHILKYHWTTSAHLAQVDFLAVEGADRAIEFKDLLHGMWPGQRPLRVRRPERQRPRFVHLFNPRHGPERAPDGPVQFQENSPRADLLPSPFIIMAGVEDQGATELSFRRADPQGRNNGRTNGKSRLA